MHDIVAIDYLICLVMVCCIAYCCVFVCGFVGFSGIHCFLWVGLLIWLVCGWWFCCLDVDWLVADLITGCVYVRSFRLLCWWGCLLFHSFALLWLCLVVVACGCRLVAYGCGLVDGGLAFFRFCVMFCFDFLDFSFYVVCVVWFC